MSDAESQIVNFVKGNLKISEKRVFDKVEYGGLGLFKVKVFLNAQMCSWLKRATSLDEIWKMELYAYSPGNICRIKPEMFASNVCPLLLTLANCIDNLVTGHSKINSNYKKAYVFNNPAFTLGVRGVKLDENSWGPTYNPANINRYYKLTFDQIFNAQGNIKEEIYQNFSFTPRDEVAKKLKKLYTAAITRYGSNDPQSESLNSLLNRVRKGSKTYRNILTGSPPYQLAHNFRIIRKQS
jgi:hypothetical protein